MVRLGRERPWQQHLLPGPALFLISIQSNRFSVQAGIESCGAGLRTQSESGWLPLELPCHYCTGRRILSGKSIM